MSMIAVGEPGSLQTLPDMYMRKLAVGPRARAAIDLRKPVAENIGGIAEAFGRSVNDVTTIVLDRPRHHDLIEEIRASGARIKLIQDGDVTASISAAIRGTNDHLAIGIGGTRQAILSAAALRCLGGGIQAQLWPTTRSEIEYVRAHGIEDVNRIFGSEEYGARYFHIGRPLDMETPICIDLEGFIERSNGVFGKTGTGKTFLTRLVLAGLIHKDRAVNLIFDMHSEYG